MSALVRSMRRVIAAVVLSVVVVLTGGVVAGAAPAAASTVTTQQKIAYAVLSSFNHERALHHLRPLTLSTALYRSAHWQNLTMARSNTLSHQLPHEASLGSRISSAGYHWRTAGENIAWTSSMTTSGALHLQSLMYHERYPYDGHRSNILNRSFRNIGINIYFDWKHHKMWMTQDLASH